MWRRNPFYYFVLFVTLTLLLCLLPTYINGSLLEGGGHHHHHHEHEHDNNKEHKHDHTKQDEPNDQHKMLDLHEEKKASKNKIMISNKLKKSEKIRSGRKFNNNGKRKRKNFERPFPFRIPRTSFSCRDRAPGYYADMEADCQVYRMCTSRGGGQAFLCPEATRFNQRTLVCDHKFRVKCADSGSFFHRNLIIHEESMKATIQAKLRNKLRAKGKTLRKRPRLQSSEIIQINPRPNVIRTGRLNGRLRFAPLFEKRRKQNFEKFAKALHMTSPKMSIKGSKMAKPRPLTQLPKDVNNSSRKNDSKNIKTKKTSNRKQNRNDIRNRNRDEDNLLGLPELPPDITRNSPIFTINAGLNSFSFSNNKDGANVKEEGRGHDSEANVEFIGGQLLPPVAAGKSVAKFRKDSEEPSNNQLAVFLTPPPPLPKLEPKAPLQLVGHVMTSNELAAFPDSPIINIKRISSVDGQKRKSNHVDHTNNKDKKTTTFEKKNPRNGRLTSKHNDRSKSTRSRGHSHDEETRSSGGQNVGLPIQLRPVGRGMPAPLVWISPASLARSPMVSLKKLVTPHHNELFKSGNVERALTMTFPGRSTGRFDPQCLECMSITHNSEKCPPCFVVLRR